MNAIVQTILIGIGATLTMDIYALVLKALGIKTLDYRFVGRWIGHLPKERFFHHKIFDSPPITGELMIGWVAHYLIGITFAFLLVAVHGKKWLAGPSLLPALFIGLITVTAPFLIMQPAFGFGIGGSNLPDPNKARLMSLITHSVFGVGLYISALIISKFTT